MKIKLELTEAQLVWLELLLGRGMDGCFENNKVERRHCDNVYQKVSDEMKRIGYVFPVSKQKRQEK